MFVYFNTWTTNHADSEGNRARILIRNPIFNRGTVIYGLEKVATKYPLL